MEGRTTGARAFFCFFCFFFGGVFEVEEVEWRVGEMARATSLARALAVFLIARFVERTTVTAAAPMDESVDECESCELARWRRVKSASGAMSMEQAIMNENLPWHRLNNTAARASAELVPRKPWNVGSSGTPLLKRTVDIFGG